jgi:hypothetical protein
MLSVFADAHVSDVPTVRKSKVRALRLGVSVIAGDNIAGTGYNAYADVVVRTMRKDRRGLERARRIEAVRRRELMGREEEIVVNTDDASGGMTGSGFDAASTVEAAAFVVAWASLRSFCRRRWGSSTRSSAVNGEVWSLIGIEGVEAVKEVEDEDFPRETLIERGRKALLRK